MKSKFVLLLALVSACNFVHIEEEAPPWATDPDVVTDLGYSALEFAILNSIRPPPHEPPNDASGLISLLGNIDTDRSRRLLIRLTNYYIGSHPSEVLSYSITRQGRKILGDLKEEMKRPINCTALKPITETLKETQLPGPRCRAIGERDRAIKWYIELIEADEQVEFIL